ncbi:GDP-mannose 4,6-dehydratase [Hydrogenophaga sp. A37]|uniref:GDP-mannose 4,6-dehydratase n=1 Tax=Hydrogenophaga sp. A37 TaxID=1945864 RepID=UPI000986AA41|nr:GDP-mannose 4,6-dehydratase [Hydrogenophaga sp. A37]OOG81275.1 GDP-mannose 4,6 dehydratase [Hydrogenophaga sp. A37]
MRILLTGSDGFTGRNFKAMAATAGHEVWSLQANLTDATGLREEVENAQADWVLHLAAISFVGHADAISFYSVNVIGTMNLLSALAALPIKPLKVLLASSANIYGNSEASPIGETTAPAPINHYATSKLAMEHMALTYADTLPLVLVRPFNYTGPGQAPEFLIPKLVKHFAERAHTIELGNLHVEREFNDVRMVCSAYLALLALGKNREIYNVCSGETHSLQDVIARLKHLTGHTINVKVNPAFVRANEVHRLCGSPEKMTALIGPLATYTLDETLRSMLQITF